MALLGGADGDDDALRSGPCGPAGAVQVRLVFGGRVDVHDEGHVVDMDAAGGDVGGDEDADRPVAEGGEVALTRVLAQVPVHVHSWDPAGGELLGELLRRVLGAGEGESTSPTGDELPDDSGLLGGRDDEGVVLHGRDGGGRRVDGVGHRRIEVALDQHVDALVQGGREQQPLGAAGGLVQQPLHRWQEAEVGHVVRFVDHGDLDGGERAVPLVDQVLESAGGRDDDVGAALQTVDLTPLRYTAEDRHGLQSDRLGERLDRVEHLGGEFTRRHQHQGARTARLTSCTRRTQGTQQRKGEGDRLPASGPAAAQHVAPGQTVGQGGGLDRKRVGDAALGQAADEFGGHAECGETARTGRGGRHGVMWGQERIPLIVRMAVVAGSVTTDREGGKPQRWGDADDLGRTLRPVLHEV